MKRLGKYRSDNKWRKTIWRLILLCAMTVLTLVAESKLGTMGFLLALFLDIFIISWVVSALREQFYTWVSEIPHKLGCSRISRELNARTNIGYIRRHSRRILADLNRAKEQEDLGRILRNLREIRSCIIPYHQNHFLLLWSRFVGWSGVTIEMVLLLLDHLVLEGIKDGIQRQDLPKDHSAVQLLEIGSDLKYRAAIHGVISRGERERSISFDGSQYEPRYFVGGSWTAYLGDFWAERPSGGHGHFFLAGLDKDAIRCISKDSIIGKDVTIIWAHRVGKDSSWEMSRKDSGVVVKARSMWFGCIMSVSFESDVL